MSCCHSQTAQQIQLQQTQYIVKNDEKKPSPDTTRKRHISMKGIEYEQFFRITEKSIYSF